MSGDRYIRASIERLLNIRRPGLLLSLLLAPLTLCSFLFRCGVWMRRSLYTQGILKSYRLPCTVISVGNITVGGTGKTPAVCHIARVLKDAGCNVVVLSRGYRAKGTAKALTVSDGHGILAGPEVAGDEAYMLASKLPDVPILIGKDRALLGETALRDFAAQIVILDDGFHYFRLKRDLDIVLINARNPFGNGFLLPRGTLREPPASLIRAPLILLTKINESINTAHLEETLKKCNPQALVFKSSVKALAVRSAATHEMIPLDSIQGKRVIALCSIGDPDSFFSLLDSLSLIVTKKFVFPDHHWYGEADYKNIIKCSIQADFIITTEKDLAKIDVNMIDGQKLFVLETGLAIAGEEQFYQSIYRLGGISSPRSTRG